MGHYKNILFVEDDAEDQEFFVETLKAVDADVIYSIAQNGKQALDELAAIRPLPQIIFLDLNLPVIDGFQFLELIKGNELYAAIPVVVLTTSIFHAQKSFALGASLYFTKPQSVAAYTKILTTVLNSDVKKDAEAIRAHLVGSQKH